MGKKVCHIGVKTEENPSISCLCANDDLLFTAAFDFSVNCWAIKVTRERKGAVWMGFMGTWAVWMGLMGTWMRLIGHMGCLDGVNGHMDEVNRAHGLFGWG